jgi:hypothetical protein
MIIRGHDSATVSNEAFALRHAHLQLHLEAKSDLQSIAAASLDHNVGFTGTSKLGLPESEPAPKTPRTPRGHGPILHTKMNKICSPPQADAKRTR